MKPPVLCLCLLLASHAVQAAQPVLSPQGYGVVAFGNPLAAAEKRIGKAQSLEARNRSCYYVGFARYPHVRFMVENGIVTRAEADVPLANSAGIQLGTTVDQIKRRHPRARIRPHKYDDGGHYVILPSPDGRAALVFEASGGFTNSVRAGRQPAVEYVEGCS
jgi:hypothetical protein